ncbi:hypothetical protein IEQ34_015761 [Dendrobium chrysotoxum]|uniref:Uncharacterized protein n=1 Tax=Dendrobium chrysotoxum TaxID=161865 RepID=A0AAV7G1N9_DENCH|nr:hypothetical protein IEQ34_015761 [Dendrobium chrysotoxum]
MSPSKLKLFHQCGLCSPLTCEDKLSLEDKYHHILKQNQACVDYINHLDATNSAGFNPLGGSLSATVPAPLPCPSQLFSTLVALSLGPNVYPEISVITKNTQYITHSSPPPMPASSAPPTIVPNNI